MVLCIGIVVLIPEFLYIYVAGKTGFVCIKITFVIFVAFMNYVDMLLQICSLSI